MEELTDRLGVFLEKGDRLLVLGLCSRRALAGRKIGLESGEICLPYVRPKCRDTPIRVEGEEEIIAACDHGGEHRLHQRVVGIHEDVVCLEAVELEGKMHYGEARVAKQAMPEAES